jgi:hypothetical protein
VSDGTGQAEPEYAVVAQGDMGLLREVQSVLKRRGVGSHLMPPPEGCGST